MTKKVDTWMPLLVDKYLGDTQHLTTEMHGAYLLLLMAMWKRDGRLPADDQQLQTISRMPASKWRSAKQVLMQFFRVTEDGVSITQKRLSEELERANTATAAKAKAGAKGAAKRWRSDADANVKTDGTAMADASASQWQTGASIHTPSATQIQETASAVSARALVGMALKRAGIDLLRINLEDPRLTALVEQGATPAEFEGIGREAVERGIAKPMGWICTTLVARRADAAAIALAPRVESQSGEAAAAQTAAYLAETERAAAAARTPEAQDARRAAMKKLGRTAA